MITKLPHDELWPRTGGWPAFEPGASDRGERRAARIDLAVVGVPTSRTSLSPTNAHETPAAIREAVGAYFAGDLAALAAISWRTGGTDFQRSVWTALCAIPVGETVTYKQLAERIGRPGAVRAVGLANGANPVGVVVPCHRVIGSDGSLTGYGGGLERKRWLLTH